MKSQIRKQKTDLKNWSHIRIGSAAENFFVPENYQELAECLEYAKINRLNPLPLGAGSNIMFGNTDNTAIISDKHLKHFWKKDNNSITVSANYNITQFIMELAKINRGGLEFLAGIPAHLGGLVKMNAGAYKHSISEFVSIVRLMDYTGNIRQLNRDEIAFGYRDSGINGFILEITFDLPEIQGKEIVQTARNYIIDRKEKQPIQFPNIGSIFKNPKNDYAGRLLEECGFKGKSMGEIEFSQKHANFLINRGNGSFDNALTLIYEAKKAVKKEFNIDLHTEIVVVNK